MKICRRVLWFIDNKLFDHSSLRIASPFRNQTTILSEMLSGSSGRSTFISKARNLDIFILTLLQLFAE